MKAFCLALGIFISLAAASVSAEAPAKHFLYLFALDDGSQTPARNHTWATFVEAQESGNGAYAFQQQTINWLPASHVIDALAIGPKRGRNFPSEDAFRWAQRDHLTTAQWGPYETTPEFYALCARQKQTLDSGDVWYRPWDDSERIFKLLDPPSVPAPRALSGIHAISDIVYPVDSRGFLLTGVTDGIEATAKVALHLAGWYVRSAADDAYLAPVDELLKAAMDRAVGVTAYPTIQHQKLEAKDNQYCRTLKECRDTGNNLLPD